MTSSAPTDPETRIVEDSMDPSPDEIVCGCCAESSGVQGVFDQGNLGTCVRFALTRALENGFWTKKFVKGNKIDINRKLILGQLLGEHKVI